ncbi:MAG: HupE/UreJ family protein [Pseudomonadota bacterium]
MRRTRLALAVCLIPAQARAHDAFGDLGPFYESFLHPLADPLQAALLIGMTSLLARQSLRLVQYALPLFCGAALVSHLALNWYLGAVAPTTVLAWGAVVCGASAVVPLRTIPRILVLGVVIAAGICVGAAPGSASAGSVWQLLLGTVSGIAVFAILSWTALDTLSRHVSPVAPSVAGAWVVAIGLMAAALETGASQMGPPDDIENEGGA